MLKKLALAILFIISPLAALAQTGSPITVGPTPVPVYSPGNATSVSITQTSGASTAYVIYTVNRQLLATQGAGSTYTFSPAPALNFNLGQPVGFISIPKGSAVFKATGISGGGGLVSCTTPGGVYYQNGTNNTGTCSPLLTWADGINALGVFQGVPTSSLSTTLQNYANAGLPETQVHRYIISAAADTFGVGSLNLFQEDKDIAADGFVSASDFTNAAASAVVGAELDAYINVPTGQTNPNTQTAVESIVSAYGPGNINELATFQGVVSNTGTGTITTMTAFNSAFPNNSGGGTVHNVFGYQAFDIAGLGDTLNAAFKVDAQMAGAHNYGFYSDVANKDHFGSIYQNALILSSTTPSVATSGCGTTGASIVSNNGTAAFKVNVGTTNSGTCTITMPAATTDWVCSATDITTTSTTVSQTKSIPTGGNLTTEITLQNYTDISGTHAWVDSDVIAVSCMGE